MFKKIIIICVLLGSFLVAYSQDLKKFAEPKESSFDPTYCYWEEGATTKDGVIIVKSAIQGLTFQIIRGHNSLKTTHDTKSNTYILIVEPTDSNYKYYEIRVCADGFDPTTFTTKAITGGGRASYCIEVNPKQASALEKLARITVYDKDNKILVGAVVKNKTTGRVYGSTRYDGTLAINFENKGETTSVIVSHPSYSDTKEITVQAGVHDYKVYLRNYNPSKFTKTPVMWYIVPGLGQIELGNTTEGVVTILGEVALLGGGLGSYLAANKQLDKMKDVDVSFDGFMNAKRKYNTQRAINIACYVGAAALYGVHLYRVYCLSKKAKNARHASLTPTIITTDETMAFGLSLNINF